MYGLSQLVTRGATTSTQTPHSVAESFFSPTTLRIASAVLRFIVAAPDPLPEHAQSELGLHVELLLDALRRRFPVLVSPRTTATLRFLLALPDPLPASAQPDADIFCEAASASLCVAGPTFKYCFSFRHALESVLGSLASMEALAVLAVAAVPTPWFQNMTVRTLRHFVGVDRLEEQVRSESARRADSIRDRSDALACQDREHKLVQTETETKVAFVKALPRQHGCKNPAGGLKALRDAVTTVRRDRKTAEARAQHYTRKVTKNVGIAQAFQHLVESPYLDEPDGTEVGMLQQALRDIRAEWFRVRAREKDRRDHHPVVMASQARRIVAAIHQLNACEAEQVAIRAARDDLQRHVSHSPDSSDLANMAVNIVWEHLQNMDATEAQEHEKRKAHMVAVQARADAEEATKKRIADENAALEAEEAMYDELEATHDKIEKTTEELTVARAAAVAAMKTHNRVVTSYYPLEIKAEADEEALEQTVEGNKRTIAELKARLAHRDGQYAAEVRALKDEHRDEMTALQDSLQNKFAAEYNAIQEKRAEMQRILAELTPEERFFRKEVAAAMKRLEKTEEGAILWTTYTPKG